MTIKRYLARQYFQHVGSNRAYPLVRGCTTLTLREITRDRVQFKESVCNAGLISTATGYTCVAKNQRFSFCNELHGSDQRKLGSPDKSLDDGARALYRIDFDLRWGTPSIRRLSINLDGKTVDPVIFIEDVRLVTHGDSILAFANGNGAWPLLGTLEDDTLVLRTAVADFVAPQKNWMPFEYEGRIYLEHSIQPHVILNYDPESASCTEIHRTSLEGYPVPAILHGGAPALRLNDDYFLGVGNSQHLYWFQERYYAAVFYLFEAKPPFRVVKATRPLRVQSRRERIHYISGLALGEDQRSLILSIGICDCDNRIVQVLVEDVLSQLQG